MANSELPSIREPARPLYCQHATRSQHRCEQLHAAAGDFVSMVRDAGSAGAKETRTDRDPAPGQKASRANLLASFLPLYVVIFVGFVGYSLMITVLTPALMSNHNLLLPAGTPMSRRIVMLSFLLCLYPLGQFAGSPILGSLSDRFGRKPVLLVSLSVTTVCYALIVAALTIRSFVLLAVASLITGTAEANIVAAQSAIADVVRPEERSRFFGYIYMSVSAAYIIGPLVGGKLADPKLIRWFNDATPFAAVLLLLVFTTAATALLFRETNPPEARSAVSFTQAFTNLKGVFVDRRLRGIYWLNFFFYFAIFGFFRCYPMYLVGHFHLEVSRVSELIAWVGVPIVIANLWLTGFLATRVSTKTLATWSATLTGIFMITVVVFRPAGALWVTLFLTSGALALCLPACATLLSQATTEAEQGRVMGNNQALQVGAEALSGFLGGLAAALMVELPLILLGLLAITAAMFLKFGTGRGTGDSSPQTTGSTVVPLKEPGY
jgi:MFS family permease